ncbi:DUF3426 domain-containing protein [Pseudomaricurvus sp. HS19]|uniref:DUF3426 domain-containing protein n=1 Tax=Pseudomaricurvus sp. HS19 TaxID=2692626 RepID=UPI00136BD0D8|nr:DUF3426 domain-containing protein [Pseudomaricurvus sp. HS19]MYM64368.1 DUF3426 domain-containing protein [Pseudomaricurvus sp. HS19]
MAERITCCPHCSTSFRVTDAQLQTAKGAVRCGSCLQIFRALDHLEEAAAATPDAAPAAATSPFDSDDVFAPDNSEEGFSRSGGDRFDPHRWDDAYEDSGADDHPDLDDNELISDDMDKDDGDDLHLGELSDAFLEEAQGRKGSLFDRPARMRETRNDDHSDESWALNLLEEIEGEEQSPNSESGSDPDDDMQSLQHQFRDTDDLDSSLSPTDFGELTSFGTEAGDNDQLHNYDRNDAGSFHVEEEQEDDDHLLQELGESHHNDEPLFRLAGDPEPRPATAERTSFVDAIAPAPVEMDWHPPASPWPKRLLWGSLSLLALLVLAAQYGWYRFDDLSRQQPWRNVYAQVCPLIGCQLPSLYAPEKVKAYNLVVRSHPRTQGALVVDSILLNTAGFEQPFPDFVLAFSSLHGEQLAARRFTPREYLGGELAGATMMPPGQPVHISLELVDPGADAVNYTAHIPTDTP